MNYQESSISGIKWVRCNSVSITNPLSGTPKAYFTEESVVKIGSEQMLQPFGQCSAEFRADGSFPLLDPDTGRATGMTMSHQDLYKALYSLYMKTATDRDLSV